MRNVRIDRPWAAWMVLGTAACVLYPFLPHDTAAPVLYCAVGLAALIVTIAGIRRNRPGRLATWWLFTSGFAVWYGADVLFAYEKHVLHQTSYPSPADPVYFLAYPLFVAGLLRLVHGRSPRDMAAMLDAGIIATGVGLVYWVLVLGPQVDDATLGAFERFVDTGYPAGDALVFTVLVRMLFSATWRTPASVTLVAGGVMLLFSDISYSIANAVTVFSDGLTSTGWLFWYVLWAGAALHPSMRTLAPAPAGAKQLKANRVRMSVVAAATMLTPMVLLVQGGRQQSHLDWLAIGLGVVLMFVLVLTRMAGFVTQVQRQSQQLEDLAMHDELTGLANRRRFEQRVREALAGGAPQVAVLDVADFKNVNDRLGHAAGDRVLAAIAERLTGRLREGDLVARLGGDEFAVLVPRASAAEGDAIVDRLAAALSRPIVAGEHELLLSARVGVADADGTDDPGELLRRADVALQAAKTRGEKSHRYTAELDERADERARLGAAIRAALDTGQFRLVYQPIVELPHGRIVSVEALIRWEHPERGFVSPADFIPVAEQNGLIVELGEWILKTACAQAVAWHEEFGALAPRRMSVNVSARQLAEPGFARVVADTLAWTGLGAHNLLVEVTETAVFGGGLALQAVHDLHDLGVRIALDDFGTGHSSLGLLQTIPADVLKVDKSFVDNVTMAGRHAVIAEALIQVSNGLGLTAVAEGVETAEQADELYRMGYQLAQGYHFGRPVPVPDFRAANETATAV